MSACIAPRRRGDRAPCGSPREPGSLFCRQHEQAPAAQRGGWLSAERRRRRMAGAGAAEDAVLDVSNLLPRLWIGAAPPVDRDLPTVDVLALCAREYQPSSLLFHGAVVRCPLPTGPLGIRDVTQALQAARAAAIAHRAGRCVLVTSLTGEARAALVAGLAIGMLTTTSPAGIVALIRARRSTSCFEDPALVRLIGQYVGNIRDGRWARRS